MLFLGFSGGCSKGLSSQHCRLIFTKIFRRINATKLDNLQAYFAKCFKYLSSRIVISAVRICIITAFSEVPIKVLM